MRVSSALRLALLLSGLFCATAMVAGVVAWVVLGDELKQRLTADAQNLATGLAADLEGSGPDDLTRYIVALTGQNTDHATLYYFLPTSGQQPVGDLILAHPFTGARKLVAGTDFPIAGSDGDSEGEGYYAYGILTRDGTIIVARDSQWITDSQEFLLDSLAWGLGVALVATVLSAFVIGQRNMHRVAQLNEVLVAVSLGDLAARYPEGGEAHDDIGAVARGINAMLERLEANVERLAQVSADIAHDLRSPLTRLRLRLEPHALRADLPEDTRRAIATSLESLDSVTASFDAILQLSQMETGNMVIEMAPVDLSGLAREVFEMMAPVADEQGHRLELRLPVGPVVAEVSAELLTQALVNLVDNAMRHAPAPAAIRIILSEDEDQAGLSVTDDGPGIPATDREKVTRRFYRLDRSRNRPGTGLGLSLVSAIAQLHGGRLELADNKPGLRATIFVNARKRGDE